MRERPFDTTAFQAAMDSTRAARGLNWKEVSQQSGITRSTLSRMAQGKNPDVNGLAMLLAWSGLDCQAFIRKNPDGPGQGDSPGTPDPLASITAQLHTDPGLTPQGASALDDIIQAAYRHLRTQEKDPRAV